jgi:diaminobutyrate-2-oxoglutarate transaminase
VVTQAIQRALADQLPLSTLDLTTPAKDAFTTTLMSVLPEHLRDGRIMFCGPTGADAVEAAMKLARTATGRTGFLAFGGAYHGMTQGTLAVSGGTAAKEPLGALLHGVHHTPFPGEYRCVFGEAGHASALRCAQAARWVLDDDYSGVSTPAAAIIEPVQGEGGVHPAPAHFAPSLREDTRRHGVLVVADEVQTGLGRTGSMWASDPIGLEPDVLVMSKAIGGGLPLAVIAFRTELDVMEPGTHAGTFRGNQLAMAAGEATIRHIVQEGLVERASEMGESLHLGLSSVAAGEDRVGHVRGRGLMVGAELVDPAQTGRDGLPLPDGALARHVQSVMLDEGVVVEVGGRAGAVVRFLPPLTIDQSHVEQIVVAFDKALARALR